MAAGGLLRHRSKLINRETDAYLLAKLKPRSVHADKERLFEENLALKMLNNHLQQENLRLKTRINQLDREIGRRDEMLEEVRAERGRAYNSGPQKTHLLGSLKQNVKELRQELHSKEEEIALLRRNLKSTKLGELEVEIQVYVDECTRLRHHLEEMLKQRDESPVQYGGQDDQNYEQQLYNSNIQKEFEAMADALKAAQEDANRWKLKVHENEKTKRSKRAGEVQGLRSELQKLRAQMDTFQEQSNKKIQDYEAALDKQRQTTVQTQDNLRKAEKAAKEKQRELDNLKSLVTSPQATDPVYLSSNTSALKSSLASPSPDQIFNEVLTPQVERLPPLLHKFFTRLHKALQRKRILLAVFLSLMDKNNNGYIEAAELHKVMKQNKAGMKWPDVLEVIKLMGGSTNISIRGIEAWHAKYRFIDDLSSDTSDEESASPVKRQDGKVEVQPPKKQLREEVKQADPPKKPEDSKKVEVARQPEPPKKLEEMKRIEVIKQPEEIKKPVEVKMPEDLKKLEEIKKSEEAKKVEAAKKPDEVQANLPKVDPIRKDRPTSAKPSELRTDVKQASQPSGLRVIEETPKIEVKPAEAKPPNDPPQAPTQLPAKAPVPDIPKAKEPEPLRQIIAKGRSVPSKSSHSSSSSSDDEEVKPAKKPVQPPKAGITQGEVAPILQHISFRSQLHRLQKEEVCGILAKNSGKSAFTPQDLKTVLQAQPFALTDTEAAKLAKYFIQKLEVEFSKPVKEAPCKETAKALFDSLDNWVVLAEQDEERFDRHISQLIGRNHISLKEACRLQDDSGNGIVTFKDFEQVIEDLELEFSVNEIKYMQLLFYSHNNELDRVPYKQFIKAYSKMQHEQVDEHSSGNEDNSLDEETRASIVREKLEIISKALIKSKKSVVKAFANTKGLIYPAQLLDTLRTLGIPDFDKDEFVVFIEGLQCEEEDELCISLDYLEELLAHYGVEITNPKSSSEESGTDRILDELESSVELDSKEDSDASQSHIKKVSMLESPE